MTVHGFRRYSSTYLLNLRCLENEIAEVEYVLYQTSFSLGIRPSLINRLGLAPHKKDPNPPKIEDMIPEWKIHIETAGFVGEIR
jgi:hypothetical protein